MSNRDSHGRAWYFLAMFVTWIGLYCVSIITLGSSGCRQQETPQGEVVTENQVLPQEDESNHIDTVMVNRMPAPQAAPEQEVLPEVLPNEVPAEASVDTSSSEATLVVTPVRASYDDGRQLYQQGQFREAAAVFAAYTKHHPDNLWGHYMRGLANWKSGDLREAVNSLTKALLIDAQHIKSRINLARVHLDQGLFAEAHRQALLATEQDATSNSAQRILGRTFHNLGLAEEAIAAYREALAIDHRDHWSMNNIGLILIEEERFLEALKPLARAVQIQSDIAVIHNNLGIALERAGRYAAAATAYRASLAVAGDSAKAAINLSRVKGLREEPGRSQVDLDLLARRFEDEIKGVAHLPLAPQEVDSAPAAEVTEAVEIDN